MQPKKTKKSVWVPTVEQAEFIKAKYGKMTKASLCRRLEISVNKFERYLEHFGIRANFDQSHNKRDFSGYQRVSVPGVGNPVILVKQGKCPEEAKRKYLEKFEKSGI